MAFARCLNCNKAIRYTVRPATNEAWLKGVARAIGQGEVAMLYCINCWLVPEVGDRIVVHQPGEAADRLKKGDTGVVKEIVRAGSPYAVYTVEFSNENGKSCERFMRWQIQVAEFDASETLVLPLAASTNESKGG